MAWLEVEMSLRIRRILAVLLTIWNCMMAFAGFGMFMVGLILYSYIAMIVSSKSSSSSSLLWYSYSVIALGFLMTVIYALGSQVSLSIVGWRSLFNEPKRWRVVMTMQLVLMLVMPPTMMTVGILSFLQKSTVRSSLDAMLREAMFYYKSNVRWKKKIDLMQISYRCCGVKDYADWFGVSWMQTQYVPNGGELTGKLEDGNFYTNSVPFSCCDVDSAGPCIHDDILKTYHRYDYNPAMSMTIYTDGCGPVVADTLQTTLIGCVLVVLSAVALTLLLIYRYIQTSMATSLHYKNAKYSSPGFMLAGDDLPKPPSTLPAKQKEQLKEPKVITKVIEIDETMPMHRGMFPPYMPEPVLPMPGARQFPEIPPAGADVEEDDEHGDAEKTSKAASDEPVERRQRDKKKTDRAGNVFFEDNMMDYQREKPEKDDDKDDDRDRKRKKKRKKRRKRRKKRKKKPKKQRKGRRKQKRKQKQRRKRRKKRQKKRKQERKKRRRQQRRKQRRGRQRKRRRRRRTRRSRGRGRKRKQMRKAMKAARKMMRKAAKQAKKLARKAAKQVVKLTKTAVKAALKPKV